MHLLQFSKKVVDQKKSLYYSSIDALISEGKIDMYFDFQEVLEKIIMQKFLIKL